MWKPASLAEGCWQQACPGQTQLQLSVGREQGSEGMVSGWNLPIYVSVEDSFLHRVAHLDKHCTLSRPEPMLYTEPSGAYLLSPINQEEEQ